MNIFAVDRDPVIAASMLPEKHVVKMPLECNQMLSMIFSPHHLNLGIVRKKDLSPYSTAKGAYKNHPCTVWAASCPENLAWLILHGLQLCEEFYQIYNKMHGCLVGLHDCVHLLYEHTSPTEAELSKGYIAYLKSLSSGVTKFERCMPDRWKLDTTISDQEAYQQFIAIDKPWAKTNYTKAPHRKPSWL